jgi:DNA (cytosine-5)-methyltransferase 1
VLVLSLFPGIGLLDMAFEAEGFCVVRGPDLLWGGDIRTFTPPAGKFDGVIGGPPCQAFSPLNQAGRLGLQPLAPNQIPEFERCVRQAGPSWFVMENVREAPLPVVAGYTVHAELLNNRWLGEDQNRVRRFSFGTREGRRLRIEYAALDSPNVEPCVTANGTQWERGKGKNGGRSRSDRTITALARYKRLQGLPPDFLDHAPFTVEGKVRVVGNGVPLAMGRAIARAVKRAVGLAELAA